MAPLSPLVLSSNTKGWLTGPQKQFIEVVYLPKFINHHMVDPAGAKDWANTAALALIKTFGWCCPFNIALESMVEEEGELSAEDKQMKAAIVVRISGSILTWLCTQANRVVPESKSCAKTSDTDLLSLLLACLMGTEGGVIKGQVPYQPWAKSLLNYGMMKGPLPVKFSANGPCFEHMVATFSEFLTECFDENEEADHALPVLELPFIEMPVSALQVVPVYEVNTSKDSNMSMVSPLTGKLKDGEEIETDTEKPCKHKWKVKRGDDNVAAKKAHKKRGSGAAVFTALASDQGKKSNKMSPKTGMGP
ncbi:hypothetical protein F5146DRAFT_1139173 [Armillaria mellea]|nr:hypothetical protein F5146DRAFT_1139173 [Armillaria mellea]